MKKLDRFLLRAFILPFAAILIVVVFILMLQFLWLYIDELVGKGLDMSVILEFLMWGAVTTLPLSLPLATLLSSMMTMGTLGESNELLAIRAAGIPVTRVFAPLIIASAFIGVGTYYVTNDLVPIAYNEIYTLRDDIGRTKSEIRIPNGTFYDGIEGYVMRVEDRDKKTGMMYQVIVYDHSSARGNVSVTVADSALMKLSRDKTYLTFDLFDGTNYEETNTRRWRDTTLEVQKTRFKKQELVIPLQNYSFEKSDSNRFSDEVNSMRVRQLLAQKDSLDREDGDIHARHLRSFYRSRALEYHFQLDTSRHYNSAYAVDGFGQWPDVDEAISAHARATERATEMANQLEDYGRDLFRNLFILRRTDVGILKKFATALACFIFFFIGAPIGTLLKKGGIGSSAIIAVLFFVLYWVVDISGTNLAKDGAASAFVGVFFSAFVLLPIGVYLTWRAVHDRTGLMDTTGLKTFFKKTRYWIMGKVSKTRIVYMGTPEFAVEPLRRLLDEGYDVVGVVTVPDKPAGRGMKVSESAVKRFAVERGLPLLQPEKLTDPAFLEAFRAWNPDLCVVVAFRMLPREVWEVAKIATFNLHAALLPQYRGAAPINWAVINGEKMTGVTSFKIDDGMDTGHIIQREQCRIGPEDTAGDIHDRLMELGAQVVLQTVGSYIDKQVELRLQKSYIQGSEILHRAPKLSRELCHVDFRSPAEDVHNLIRGLSPFPGAFTQLLREGTEPVQLKIFSSRILSSAEVESLVGSAPAAGTLLTDGKSLLGAVTGDGRGVAFGSVQLSGKKRMDVEEFLRGTRDISSCRFSQGTSAAILEEARK